MVFVQCAGQRDESGKHLAYCSGFCCGTSIKQAMYFKDANPAIDTVVIYDDLRVPGKGEDFYRSAQKKGVIFTKGKVAAVEASGDVCDVKFRDLILDEDATVTDADLVVLATGQVPNSGVNIDIPEEEVAKMEVKPVSILNLTYRQGKDLPQLTHGFTDSHFICFPYETRRTGIYCRRPGAPSDGHGAGDRRRHRRHAEGDPGDGERRARPRRASALGRPLLPDRAARRLHPVQALHRGMPVRRHRRGRKALPGVQRRAAAAAAAPAWAPARCG